MPMGFGDDVRKPVNNQTKQVMPTQLKTHETIIEAEFIEDSPIIPAKFVTEEEPLEAELDAIYMSLQGGTTDYNRLENKPIINGVELKDSKSLSELGIQKRLQAGQNILLEDNTISSTSPTWEDFLELKRFVETYITASYEEIKMIKDEAGRYASQAGNYAGEALQAKNEIDFKFWFGTYDDYNELSEINPGRIYIVTDNNG